jgi:ubiquinone/menaquinone biosynthesis C-methylase UbiE
MHAWIDWYDSDHTIYVNARHRDVHFLRIAQEIADYVPSPDATVVDYSCGEALCADTVAKACARLFLAEPAPQVRARVAKRFTGNPKITACSLEDIAALPAGSVDLVVMHSVSQYMTAAEFDAALATFRRILKPQGVLILGDILQPGVGAITDALALLRFGLAEGFFFAAFFGLIRTFFSDYRELRSSLGLARYSADTMLAKLSAAGFLAARVEKNIGHNPARMTFIGRPK